VTNIELVIKLTLMCVASTSTVYNVLQFLTSTVIIYIISDVI